jgi:hypothetical protein
MMYVDSLRRKPVPARATGVDVHLAGADAPPELGAPPPAAGDDTPSVDTNIKKPAAGLPRARPRITDATRTGTIDRAAVLARVAARAPVLPNRPAELMRVRPTGETTLLLDGPADKAPPPARPLSAAAHQIINRAAPKTEPKFVVLASSYYMNNRKRFISNFSRLFQPYRESSLAGAAGAAEDGDLFDNQKIARDYLNVYSPYRGLLLYHGLGLGKTCASIGIAEGFKSDKRIYIFTPASLKSNFFAELKKCGDPLYKKNQHWKFVPVGDDMSVATALAEALSLPEGYVEKRRGAWMCDASAPENFATLSEKEQAAVDDQIDAMIRAKYIDINYNGIAARHVAQLTRDGTVNPFDHSVVLVDEAHNFAGNIANQISKRKEGGAGAPDHFRIQLYKLLMDAVDARVVLLSGTPVINSPHEIAVTMNILRGYIKTWEIPAKPKDGHRMTSDEVRKIIEADSKIFDYVDYRSNGMVIITRNPYGFVNADAPQTRVDPVTRPVHARKTRKRAAMIPEPETPNASGEDDTDYNGAPTAADENPSPEIKDDVLPSLPSNTNDEEKEEEEDDDPPEAAPADTEPDETPKPYSSGIEDGPSAWSSGPDVAPPAAAPVTAPSTGVVIERRRVTRKARPVDDAAEAPAPPAMSGGVASAAANYNGIMLDDTGNVTDAEFVEGVCNSLVAAGVVVTKSGIKQTNHMCLPDTLEDFAARFLNANADGLVRTATFKKRIIGLTSYFRTAQESLLPRLVEAADGSAYNIVRVEMSDYQFGMYVKARQEEEAKSKSASKSRSMSKANDMFGESASAAAYRLNTRACCNFAFPSTVEKPAPAPSRRTADPDAAVSVAAAAVPDDAVADTDASPDEEAAAEVDESKDERIVRALAELDSPDILGETGLATYSPKFVAIVDSVRDPAHVGLHLLYSFFASLEGIGILRLAMKRSGFAEFEPKRVNGEWVVETDPEDADKPRFAVYSGSTHQEAKEIIRDVYNNNWAALPPGVAAALPRGSDGNLYGAAIKLLMITAAGAEGINLRNTRYVHIVEPYWHMVRLEQVIGRARRLKSHMDLPEELRTVEAFVYMSVFTDAQMRDNATAQMRMKDVSRYDDRRVVSADETLFENASIKNKVNQQLLKCLKETSIECNIHSAANAKENLECFTFGEVRTNGFAFAPMVDEDMEEKRDTATKAVTFASVRIGGTEYALDKETNFFYDMASFKASQASGSADDLVYLGRLVVAAGDGGRKLVDFGDAPPVI